MKFVETTLNGLHKIVLPQHRAERPEWHNEVGWEKARLNHMFHKIGEGDVVYYAGSELGEFAALCQMWGARVVNIEPNHLSWPVIRGTWEANKLSPPLLNFAGFASNVTRLEPKNPNRELRQTLYKGKGWELVNGWPRYSQGRIVKAHGFNELYLEADGHPQVKLDDIPSEFGIDPPTVIIMDVEGSEYEVLKGSEELIKDYKPKIYLSLHPEFLYHQYRVYSREVRDWLKDRGYTEKLLDYEHEVHLYYE